MAANFNVKKMYSTVERVIYGNNYSLSDSNGIRTHNHLVRKRTLNHLAKLAKWFTCFVSTYLYGTFDCMLLSCHIRVSEWIHTLYFVTQTSDIAPASSKGFLDIHANYTVWIYSQTRNTQSLIIVPLKEGIAGTNFLWNKHTTYCRKNYSNNGWLQVLPSK